MYLQPPPCDQDIHVKVKKNVLSTKYCYCDMHNRRMCAFMIQIIVNALMFVTVVEGNIYVCDIY